MRKNHLKEKLAAGLPVFGCSLTIPSPQLVEMLAVMGFDWVLLDREHDSLSMQDVELMAMAAESKGITAIARPASNDPVEITRLMDRGVMGVQVPHVSTAEEARQAVRAVKFGADSLRGLAFGSRPHQYGLGGNQGEFAALSDKNSLVCVQLETKQALLNAHEILETDGVDVFFVGPSDLSQSLGHSGNTSHPYVVQNIVAVLRRITAAGKVAGMPVSSSSVKGVVEKGVQYIHTYLPQMLHNGCRAFLGAVPRETVKETRRAS